MTFFFFFILACYGLRKLMLALMQTDPGKTSETSETSKTNWTAQHPIATRVGLYLIKRMLKR